MRWRLTLSVLIGVAIGSGSGSVTAQQNTAPQDQLTPRSVSSDEAGFVETDPLGLIPDTQVAKFRLILGRLSLDPPAHIKCERSADLRCGGTERVEVTANRGIPSLHYNFETVKRRLTVDVNDADHVRIRSVIHNDLGNEQLKIDQPARGAIKVSYVGEDKLTGEDLKQEFKIASLVHFRASYPDLYKRHLVPMFARLMERGPVTCDTVQLVDALESSSFDSFELHQKVDELIDSLKSPSRARRNEAEKELRQLGLPVLCLIDVKLHRSTDMDMEQVVRLQRVRNAIAPKSSDTSRQLARWLASDIAYWNVIAGELTLSQFQIVQSAVPKVTGELIRPELRVADARGN